MNPFKCVCGRRCKCKSMCAKVEVKQEPEIKEEPNDDNIVIEAPWPGVDGVYHEVPIDFDDEFNEVKAEIKSEEDRTCKDKESAKCERSNDHSAGNNDNNENMMGAAVNVQSSQPVESGKKWNGSSKGRNKRAIPRNQAAKKQKTHKCHVCNHVARDNFNLKEHLRTHTGEKPLQCDVCSKFFTHKSGLSAHKKTHGQYRCLKCKQGFGRESDKIDHETLCSHQQLECDICGYLTLTKTNLTLHMRTHSGEKPFECSICFKSFAQKISLQRHSIIHIDELPNSCRKCGQRFVTPEDKQTHELRCNQSLFACSQCDYKTINSHKLGRHMQSIHGAKKPFECEICRKQFIHRIHLNQHLSRAHSDQFPFECSKCFGGYANEEEKEVHEGSCGHRQYQCHLCNKYRRDKQKLKIHMRKDHTGERIRCNVCGASFISENYANQHMKRTHRLIKK